MQTLNLIYDKDINVTYEDLFKDNAYEAHAVLDLENTYVIIKTNPPKNGK